MKNQKGFNLIELMATIAIIAIIAAIAYPMYTNYVVDARRADGQTMLASTALELERCYSALGRYNHSGCNLVSGGNLSTIASEQGHYSIIASALTTISFTLEAVPQGAQATQDTECKTLTLDQSGAKGISGGTGNAADCW